MPQLPKSKKHPYLDAKLKALIDACPDIVPEDYSLTVFGLCDECAAKAAKETEEL